MIRQRSARPALPGEGDMGTTKGAVHFCPVASRHVSALSPASLSAGSQTRVALFRPLFQSGRCVAINNGKRASGNKVLIVTD